MTREEYNAHCHGEYRLYDTGTSWGFTLMSTSGKVLEVFGHGRELWQQVDSLCGYKPDKKQDAE